MRSHPHQASYSSQDTEVGSPVGVPLPEDLQTWWVLQAASHVMLLNTWNKCPYKKSAAFISLSVRKLWLFTAL